MPGRVTQESSVAEVAGIITPADGTVDTKIMSANEVIPPFSGYEEMNNKPYSADYFGLDFWGKLSSELDVNNIKSDVKSIEKFVGKEIDFGRLEDNITTYQKVIGDIERTLNLKDTDPGDHRVKRVADYVDILNKQRKLKSDQDELMERLKKSMGGR